MKETDEVATAPSGDETCVSGLISSVLSLIISILVWLQNVGCKGGNPPECPNTCDFNTALQQLTVYAKKADELGPTSSGSKTKRCSLKKDDSKKNLKKSKSGDSHSVMYAVDQNENLDPDCRKCCKKVIIPKEKKDDNVIFEVVAAQMVEAETQTDATELVDSSTETDEIIEDKAKEVIEHVSFATQVSKPNLSDEPPQPEIEMKDASVQVEIIVEKEVKDAECECEIADKDANVRFKDDSCLECDTAEVDYDEDDEDEEYLEPGEPDWLCADNCPQYLQHRQTPEYRQPMQYPKAPGQIRQERPSYYPGYEAPMYNRYNERYAPRDVYGPMRYIYPPPRPYYQKITRTIHRGSPLRTAEYQDYPRRQMSSTQRPLTQNAGVDQSPPLSPTVAPSSSVSPRISKNENMLPREQPVGLKECVPSCPGSKIIQVPKECVANCPGSKINQISREPPTHPKDCLPICPGNKPNPARKTSVTPPNQAHQKLVAPTPQQADKGDVSRSSSKKCVAKCANKNQSNQQKPAPPPKEKPRQVALMPKGAIPVEPREVLQVEEAPPKQQTVVPDSVMSVEASKRTK